MNWTGGRLSRHSNTKGSLRARQRQHFAKTQANLRNGTKKPSPLKFPIFSNATEDNPSSTRRPLTSLRDSQAIQPRKSNQADTHSPLQGSPSYGPLSHMPPSNGQRDRAQQSNRDPNRIPDDDLYSATPRPRESKRKPTQLIVSSQNNDVLNQDEVEFEKRRRILRKGDWVGVSIQRPIQLAFTSPKHGELVGKRRKVSDSHRAQYNHNIQSRAKSPFMTRDRRRLSRSIDEPAHHGPNQGRSDVRISIGGRVFPPGISSSSGPSRRRDPSSRSYLYEQTPRSSSDVMLLDNEELTGRKLTRASKEGVEPVAIYRKGSNSYDREQSTPLEASPTNLGEDEYPLIEEDIIHKDHFNDRFEAVRGAMQSRGRDGHSSTIKRYGHGRDSQNSSTSQGQPIVSSSTASLHHPKPRSLRTSILLRSDSTELDGSTIAQVGKAQSIIPSPQTFDSDLWESWVKPLLDETPQGTSDGYETKRISISPGISYAPISRHMQTPLRSGHTNENLGWEPKESPPSENCHITLPPRTSSPLTWPGDQGHLYHEKPLFAKVGDRDGLPLDTSNVQTLATRRVQPNDIGINKALSIKTPKILDADSIWKKFVFGSSDDEFEAGINHARTPALRHGRRTSPASSLLAIPSVGSSIDPTISIR